MAEFFTTTVANGQSVSTDKDLVIKSIQLTGGAADAVAKIYSNGVEKARISCKAGSSQQFNYLSGSNEFNGKNAIMPVTCDLSGTGAALEINY